MSVMSSPRVLTSRYLRAIHYTFYAAWDAHTGTPRGHISYAARVSSADGIKVDVNGWIIVGCTDEN